MLLTRGEILLRRPRDRRPFRSRGSLEIRGSLEGRRPLRGPQQGGLGTVLRGGRGRWLLLDTLQETLQETRLETLLLQGGRG